MGISYNAVKVCGMRRWREGVGNRLHVVRERLEWD